MIEFLNGMTCWHWLIAGLVLICAEMFAPGMFIMWPGLAAIAVGVLCLILPGLPWQFALTLWALLSVAFVTGWIAYRRRTPESPSAAPLLNRRGEQYVGRKFILTAPLQNGKGEVRVDDTVWRVTGDADLPSGASVKVVAVEGTSLRVEPA